MANRQPRRALPKRIILVRHGESEANADSSVYTTTPDHKITLTPLGLDQARAAGEKIRRIVSEDGKCKDWKVYFYVSPYERTRSTLCQIGKSFSKKRIIGVAEDCRVREQEFGNFQAEEMETIKQTRMRYGTFFFRLPDGESSADVFDRISSLLESFWRDIHEKRLRQDEYNSDELNLIIVSHGLTSRVFLMKWFKWTAEQFENLRNFDNCEVRVMALGTGGEYSLAVHHSDEEFQKWGLSPDMIADQKWRMTANRGDWIEKCPWYLDGLADESDDDNDDAAQDEGDQTISHLCHVFLFLFGSLIVAQIWK